MPVKSLSVKIKPEAKASQWLLPDGDSLSPAHHRHLYQPSSDECLARRCDLRCTAGAPALVLLLGHVSDTSEDIKLERVTEGQYIRCHRGGGNKGLGAALAAPEGALVALTLRTLRTEAVRPARLPKPPRRHGDMNARLRPEKHAAEMDGKDSPRQGLKVRTKWRTEIKARKRQKA